MLRRVLILVLIVCVAGPIRAEAPRSPYVNFSVDADNIPKATIAGLYLPAGHEAKGTIFLCHGFRNRKEMLVPFQWIREDLGWNLVLFDFRNHGDSSRKGLPTIGYYEQWDLKAAIDWAEAHDLPKPYVCIGVSMGASIALRWAGQDPRISGVIAYSPFKTAWDAAHQFRFRGHPMGALPSLLMHGGFKRMLQDVDIPAAVSKRDDLRIWIVVGEHDWFPIADERAILSASLSPSDLKRLEVIPGAGHAQYYKWRKNDRFIADFLLETKGERRAQGLDISDRAIFIGVTGIGGAGMIGWYVLRRRLQRWRVTSP